MKVTVGLIAGIAVGVCIGVLIAPEKGSETRRKVADSAGDWMEKLKNLFSSGEEEEASGSRAKSHQRTRQTTT
jgi:gas vesicle protein